MAEDALHSFNWSDYKANLSQNQSQDSEITGAFSFDSPAGKVLLFAGFVPNPSRLWVHCSKEGEVYEGGMGRRFTQLIADWIAI